MMYSGDYQNVINSREEVLIKCLVRNSRDSHLGISKAVAQRRQKAVSTVYRKSNWPPQWSHLSPGAQ